MLLYLLTMGSRMILSQKILNSVTTLLFISNLEQKYSDAIFHARFFFPQVQENLNFSPLFRWVIWRICALLLLGVISLLWLYSLQVQSFTFVTKRLRQFKRKLIVRSSFFVDMPAFSQLAGCTVYIVHIFVKQIELYLKISLLAHVSSMGHPRDTNSIRRQATRHECLPCLLGDGTQKLK